MKKGVLTTGITAVVLLLAWALFSPSSILTHKRPAPLSMADKEGNKWTLDMLSGQPMSRFSDSADQLGPPLLVKLDIDNKGSEISVGFTITGQAGERYAGGAKKNGQRVPPPKIKFVDRSGRVLNSGQFEYG